MLTKVCKVHGNLRGKAQILIAQGKKRCKACCAEYMKKWREQNADRIAKRNKKRRVLRKKLVKSGELVKICKRHGILAPNRVHVDGRGVLVCLDCSNEKNKLFYKKSKKALEKLNKKSKKSKSCK